jgi:hypothetical protein
MAMPRPQGQEEPLVTLPGYEQREIFPVLLVVGMSLEWGTLWGLYFIQSFVRLVFFHDAPGVCIQFTFRPHPPSHLPPATWFKFLEVIALVLWQTKVRSSFK